MLIIIDKKIPKKAKRKLAKYGELMELKTRDITYDAISGHPDIFFSQVSKQLVVAPNLPEHYQEKLENLNILFILGELEVGSKYPANSRYNIVADQDFIIHNFRNTDYVTTGFVNGMDLIQVDQGYTRCNLIALGNKHFITSDKGIARTLKKYDLKVLYVNPKEIQLPGFKNGFIGGCAGIYQNKIFFIGKLDYLSDADKLKDFLRRQNYEIIELYDGPLFDGGSIFFIE
jgi:ribosomal protein L30E